MRLLFFFACTSLCLAQHPSLESIQKDLKDSQEQLVAQRKSLHQEQLKISSDFEKLRQEIHQKRRLVRLARMEKEDRKAMLATLRQKHAIAKNDNQYNLSLLKDFATRLHVACNPGEKLPTIEQPVDALQKGIARLNNLLGGSKQEGEASDSEGNIHQGQFIFIGPATWFVSPEKQLGGNVFLGENNALPSFISTPTPPLLEVINGKQAILSIDATGGKALALEQLNKDRFALFSKGGFWIWPILAIAFFSLIAALLKLWTIWKIRTPKETWVTSVLSSYREGNLAEAKNLALSVSHPAGKLIARCLDVAHLGADVVEEVLYERLIGITNTLQKGLTIISVTAATSPLLGLLGTVSGMIATFSMITVAGSGDAKPLAGGISEALITTLFGLIVAIPSLLIHSFLSRRVKGILQTSEQFGLLFSNGLRTKTMKER